MAARASGRGIRVIAIGKELEPSSELAPFCAEYIQHDLTVAWPATPIATAVVHLAGLAAVGPSFTDPQHYIDVNSRIMTHLCEALLIERKCTRVVTVSSGSVYLPPTDGQPLDETALVVPSSPYAVAKILVETQAAYYASRGVDTVIARPFNHFGPGQRRGFLLPDLTSLLKSPRLTEPMLVGNLDSARDYTDVRDVADAYLSLATSRSHRYPVYNVASGRSLSGFEILQAVASTLGVKVPQIQADPKKMRPNDPTHITGSARRLSEEFGWAPSIDWRTSIADFVAAMSRN